MIDFINILTITNLTLLALFMGVRKVNTLTNRIFALVIFTPATDFIINYLIYKGTIHQVPYLVFLNVSFLWGPLLFWYILLMLGHEVRLNFKTALHLLPQLISWAFWIYAFAQGSEYIDNIFARRAAYDYPLPVMLFQVIVLSQILGYTSYGTYLIYTFKTDASNRVLRAKITWLKQFMILLVVLAVLNIICFGLFESADNDYIITPALYMVFYFMVVYKSFQSFGVFPDSTHIIHVRQEVVEEETVRKERYRSSLLKPEQLQEISARLVSHLETHEPYVDAALGLADLSAALDITPHQLSQAVNQSFDKNFADLINGYRVNKSKQLLLDPSTAGLTLEAIGFQSGFGSPSAFYRAFKKHTGITPKAFLKTAASR